MTVKAFSVVHHNLEFCHAFSEFNELIDHLATCSGIQTYMLLSTERSKEQRKLMKMERKRGPAIASWLHNNDIPLNMNKMIMSYALRELDANKDVNVENILSIGLPLDCLKLIKRHLCLATLKKVSFSFHQERPFTKKF